MVAVLVKIFGSENYELAEDVVQDALLKALETWKYGGMPENPRAWLYRVAKNKAIDVIRREKHSQTIDFSAPERKLFTSEYTLTAIMENHWQEGNIKDDFLGMMYACCRPEISEENQVTFILKSLCGFSTREVARSFLTTEDTISKRLYRTKEYFRKTKTKPAIPSSQELGERTHAVLNSIYLLFSEGYNATHASRLIREDLIGQAMLLCRALMENERTRLPEASALMALMCLHSARNSSRLTEKGELIPLARQDRTKWDKELISMGNDYLNKAAAGSHISTFHLEAAIAWEHCTAAGYQRTNWRSILGYYDALLAQFFDPIVFLNRSIVLMELEGPQKALEALEMIKNDKQVGKYYLYHAVLGELYQRLGNVQEARVHYEQARHLTLSKQEQRFLSDKLAVIER